MNDHLIKLPEKLFVLLFFLCPVLNLNGQEIQIIINDTVPYYVDDTIEVSIYLKNTTTDTLTFFDSRGPSWESFTEVWDMNVDDVFVEILPMNGAYNGKYTDSTFITLLPGNDTLIREKSIPLERVGLYSLSYTQEQGVKLIQKQYADSTVSDSLIQSVTTFSAIGNTQFLVHKYYDTTIYKLLDMNWEEWKDFRHLQLYSRDHYYDNIYAALQHPQEVYKLDLYCQGFTLEEIKRIGRLKNLKALNLFNYELDTFPEEITKLNIFELTLLPKDEKTIIFPYGLSENKTIRELRLKIFGVFPAAIMEQYKLISLDISEGAIDSIPNLSTLKNLEVLAANNNNIESLKGIGFDGLPALKDINFSGNRAIKSIEPILSCTGLEFVVINRTRIDSIPDEIENLTKLKKLSVSNGLTHISDSICNLEDIRYLSFGGNRSLTQIPDSIIKMKKLLHFDASSTKIQQLPEGLAELPLKNVFIYNTDCKVTKDYKELRRRLGEAFKE